MISVFIIDKAEKSDKYIEVNYCYMYKKKWLAPQKQVFQTLLWI